MMKRFLISVSLAITVTAAAAPLKIGWATTDISTDKPIFMQGTPRERQMQGLRDPLMTTALVIDNGEDCVIFNSWDTCCVLGFMAKRVRAEVAKKCPEIPVKKIIMNATHTHNGPALMMKYKDEHSVAYRDALVEKVADTIVRAWKARKPGKIGYGYDFVVIGFSRRPVYFDDVNARPLPKGHYKISGYGQGKGFAKLHGDANDPMFSHMEAAPDPFVNFLFTFDMNDKLTGVVFNAAMPSQASLGDMQLTSDYWHNVRCELKEIFGDGIFMLPQCAAAGDLTYRMPYYKKATDRKNLLLHGRKRAYTGEFDRIRIAEQLMAAFRRTLAWASKDLYTDLPIEHISTTIRLKRCSATPEEVATAKQNIAELEAIRKNPPWPADKPPKDWEKRLEASIWRNKRIINLPAEVKKKPTWRSEFHVLRIGEVAFVSERYELYTDFGQRIQARSPFTQTFTIQCCAGGPDDMWTTNHYLATERAFANGGYQANVFDNANAPSPEGGQQMVNIAVKLLYRLKAKDKAPAAPGTAPAKNQTIPST
jgi:hypothetical protein